MGEPALHARARDKGKNVRKKLGKEKKTVPASTLIK